MNHHREGSGPPLVLIHGVGHHWQGWKAVIPDLARDFDVIACDSPGFGHSAPLRHAGPPTIPAYVDAFERWLAEQGIERPHVAGNSMGGAIALELARRGVAASATAFSPAGFWTPAELKWCQLALGAIIAIPPPVRPAVRALAAKPSGRAALFAVLYRWPKRLSDADAAAALQAAWDAPAFPGALAAFDHYTYETDGTPLPVPATVAWGNRDRLLPFRLQAPRAKQLVPEAEHVALGAGHLPVTDDPPAVAATIRRTAARARLDSTHERAAALPHLPPAGVRGAGRPRTRLGVPQRGVPAVRRRGRHRLRPRRPSARGHRRRRSGSPVAAWRRGLSGFEG